MITDKKNEKEKYSIEKFQFTKDNIIKQLSKIEMDIIALDKTDFNAVLNIYKRIKNLKESVNHIKLFSEKDNFILTHIKAHIEKYEYYLKNKYRI